MKKINTVGIIFATSILFSSLASFAADKQKDDFALLDGKIKTSIDLFDEMMDMPDSAIPVDLLSNCSGVAIFPGVLSGGLMIGGRYGKGIILARDPKTGKWSPPSFFTLKGLSYGLQIGGQAIDLILVITTQRGMESFLKNNVTLGGDLAAAAGPIGRDAAADTDLKFKASIFSYSRSKGLFLGISLKGVSIKPDLKANKDYYGKELTAEEIFYDSKVKPTESIKKLIEVLGAYSK